MSTYDEALRLRLVTGPTEPIQVIESLPPVILTPTVEPYHVMVPGPAPMKIKRTKTDDTQHHDVKTQKHSKHIDDDDENGIHLAVDPLMREYLSRQPQTQGEIKHALTFNSEPEVDTKSSDSTTSQGADLTASQGADLTASLQLESQIQSKEFLALLIVALFGAVIFMLNASVNDAIVKLEHRFANGLSMGWFWVINLVIAVLIAHMVYRPYVIERSLNRSTVVIALILYVLAEMFWSLVLFHSRINRGTADMAAVLLLAATVWLGWVCYHYAKDTIFIFILLLGWCFYLIDYTFSVDSRPWVPVPIP